MRYSALWSAFFFVGLILACARVPEGMLNGAMNPASPGAHPKEQSVVMHHVKVALESADTRPSLEARERTFAPPLPSLPSLAQPPGSAR